MLQFVVYTATGKHKYGEIKASVHEAAYSLLVLSSSQVKRMQTTSASQKCH